MFLNCVNADVVAHHEARQKAKELSNAAKQRSKDIAETGESRIKPILSPIKSPRKSAQYKFQQQSLNLPITPKSLSSAQVFSSSPSASASTLLMSSSSSLFAATPTPSSSRASLRLSSKSSIRPNNDSFLADISSELSATLKEDARQRVDDAVMKVQTLISETEDKRNLSLQLAQSRLEETSPRCSPTSNKIVAGVFTDRARAMDARVKQLKNITTGLKELETNVKNDIVDPDDIEKDIQDILALIHKPPKVTNAKLLINDETEKDGCANPVSLSMLQPRQVKRGSM